MASASPSPLASSVEKTNGNKLSRLLIDGGTTALKNAFDRYHPPTKLAADLNSNYPILNNLLRKRILNRHQWDKLFPPGGAVPDSNTFDITLLFLLLTTICGLSPPLSGWHAKPSPGDNSLEGNLARVKFFRNELYGHVTSSGVDTASFSALWQDISTALISLGLDQAEVDRLKAEHGGEEDYFDVLIEWADSEEDIKTQLKDIRQSQTMAEKAIGEVHRTQLKLKEEIGQALSKTQDFQESFSLLEGVRESQSKTKQDVGEIRESLHEVKQEVKNLAKRRHEQADEVLKVLVKSEFRGDIECHAQKFQEGTRQWVFKSIESWLDDRSSPHRVMVISGNAGLGKTVLSAVVAQRTQKVGRLFASHFCQHNNSRYRDPRLMLQSLACHLSHVMPDYKDKLVEQLSRNLGRDLNSMGVEELFALLLKEPLSTVDDPGRNSLIVIDGLDESEYHGRNELLNVIRNHFSLLPVWIRILITTRPERNITEALRHLEPIELEQKQEENLKDIQLLFEKQLSEKIGQEHRQAVLSGLVKKSEGIFIYAYFIVDFIQKNVSSLTPDQMESVLPSGISSVYLSYFKQLENELCKELKADEDPFLRFLCALTASREPLPVEFIAKILNQGAGTSLTAQRKVNKAIAIISTLLPVREGRLSFFHKSIKDWLVGSSPYGQHDFVVDEKEGHDVLSNLCASELDSIKQKGIHDRQFTNTEIYALHHATQHMLQVTDYNWPNKSKTSEVTAELVYQYVTNLELIYAKLCVNSTSITDDLLSLHNEKSGLLSKEGNFVVTSLIRLLRKHAYILPDNPLLFFQCLINEGIPELASTAAGILDSSTPKIKYMTYLDKEEGRGADQAKFYCSDKVACFDVSPDGNYMVCECRDGTIHLWSLQTGIKVWVRPSPTKREYGCRNVDASGAYLQPVYHFLSFYHSVTFHPKKQLVLPGTLRYVYTISGDRKDLFPESNCTFSNCVLRSDLIITHCPTEPKRINIWNLENGQKLSFIDIDKDIFSFAVSDDGSRLAFSNFELHHYRTIIIIDLELKKRLNFAIPDAFDDMWGLLRFTSNNDTLVCGSIYSQCPDYFNCDTCDFHFISRKGSECLSITPLNSFFQDNSPLKDLEYRHFVLWPSVLSGTLTESDFMGKENERSFWIKKVQRTIPNFSVGFSIRLDDETLLVGSPDHRYVTMFNLSVLKSDADSTNTKGIKRDVTEIIFSMEGDTIYSISSSEYINPITLPTPAREITVWKMSTREILKKTTFPSTASIVATKTGVVILTDHNCEVPELWSFDLSERIQRIAELTCDTDKNYRPSMFSVSETMIAFFHSLDSCSLICIRSKRESDGNPKFLEDCLECSGGRRNCIDFIDATSNGGKLISSLRIKADVNESVVHVSCSSPSQVLVCSSKTLSIKYHVAEEKVTVSLRNKDTIRWERNTTFYGSTFNYNPHMFFSPKDAFAVTWNTLDEGRGLHILNADTGETAHIFLDDQKDIVDCKFVDEESLVCCSEDNYLRLFDVRTGDMLSVLDIGERPYSLGAYLYQPLVAIGLSGTRIKFVHVKTGAKKNSRTG